MRTVLSLSLVLAITFYGFAYAQGSEALEARIFVEQSTPGLSHPECMLEFRDEPARIAIVSSNDELLLTEVIPQGRPGSAMVSGNLRDGCHFEFMVDVPQVPAFHAYLLDGVVKNIGFSPSVRNGFFSFSVDLDPNQMIDQDRFFQLLPEGEPSPAHPPFSEAIPRSSGSDQNHHPDYLATIEALENEIETLEATIETLTSDAVEDNTETFTLTGELKVAAFPQFKVTQTSDGSTCVIGGDWGVFNGSAEVRVRNESGDIVAIGRLYDEFSGKLILGQDLDLPKFSDGCAFYIEIANLPAANFYTLDVEGIEIATYSYSELVDADWDVSITLYSRFD